MAQRSTIATLLFLSLLSTSIRAQNILQDTLRDFRLGEAWIYDDWSAARELAASSGKPIFAVFRCVP